MTSSRIVFRTSGTRSIKWRNFREAGQASILGTVQRVYNALHRYYSKWRIMSDARNGTCIRRFYIGWTCIRMFNPQNSFWKFRRSKSIVEKTYPDSFQHNWSQNIVVSETVTELLSKIFGMILRQLREWREFQLIRPTEMSAR